MRDQPTCIIVIPGTNCDRNYVREPPDYPRDVTRLLRLGFGLEHVQQITRDTDEVEVWSLFFSTNPATWDCASYNHHPCDDLEPVDLAPNGYRAISLDFLKVMPWSTNS
jgi:hypothetical protein